MSNGIISLGDVKQSILFARLADAAYRNSTVQAVPGLKALKNEWRFSNETTETQGVMGRWKNDVVIAFRGTEASLSDWLGTNAQVGLVNNKRGDGQVHTGFQKAAHSVYQEIKSFIKNHRDEGSRVFLCGHSLGGALATLTAGWLEDEKPEFRPRAVFTFGAPRVGDDAYVTQHRAAGIPKRTFAWVAAGDPVPKVAPYLFGYRHVAKSQYRLSQGCVGKTSLDRKAEIQLEDEFLEGIPAAKKLLWFARRVDDAATNASTQAHSISGSYLRQLMKLSRSLT